jgi:hypothetical protein
MHCWSPSLLATSALGAEFRRQSLLLQCEPKNKSAYFNYFRRQNSPVAKQFNHQVHQGADAEDENQRTD